ncbi:hypothetical protein [Spiroplasma endosymbiont of Seladonia tumulorum]|uniref:hypothetical protein n=1 Tax=Spiroplasma endosymbiont of Seladonia tumulorum TaxID=3066321 RepID=UPI0030CBDDB4
MDLKQEKFLFTDGEEHLITDFQKEKGYIFFPKAATPGCTLETIAYNRYYQKFLIIFILALNEALFCWIMILRLFKNDGKLNQLNILKQYCQ